MDALVAEQERLIALLKEKRQAVISHAVTKGLDPNAPMKDSGVAWLGQVPAHWEVRRLKYLGEAITGLTYDPSQVVSEPEGGTLVLRSSNVQRGRIVLDDNVYVATQVPPELIAKPGDILICSRNGSRALIGKNATITDEAVGATWGAFMTVFRSMYSRYLSCVFNSPLFEAQAGAFLTSTINQLTIGMLNDFAVPLPPPEERDAVADFIAAARATTERLIDEAERAIALLKERRAALISAAVTGKIDVRGLAAPAETEATAA
jgi:type I restriction enzyme S subunit